jgi:sugar lactone lactonase YvrE
MNDGACDPQGRFWAGTMAYDESPGAGVLYRLELDGSCTTVLTGLTISNGIGWSPDGATMYLADSGTGLVEAFGFDGATGDLSRAAPWSASSSQVRSPTGSPSTRKGGSG